MERLQELTLAGWRHVPASPRQANNCLLDALLLTLTHANCAPSSLLNDERERRDACAACRRMLVQSADIRLRPRQLSCPGSGTILTVTEAEHNAAYLQCDIHGPTAARFFLERYNHRAVTVGSVRITLRGRWLKKCI